MKSTFRALLLSLALLAPAAMVLAFDQAGIDEALSADPIWVNSRTSSDLEALTNCGVSPQTVLARTANRNFFKTPNEFLNYLLSIQNPQSRACRSLSFTLTDGGQSFGFPRAQAPAR